MKNKIFIFAIAVSMGLSLDAAELIVSEPVKIEIEQSAYHPVISPDGSMVLFTTPNYHGLKSLDLSSKEIEVIDTNRLAGLDPSFTPDGHEIMFRNRVEENGLVKQEVKSYRFKTGETMLKSKATRKTLNIPSLSRRTTYAVSEFTQINVVIDGKSQIIKPIADGYHYQFPSISPSGEKLMFCESYTGVWVSDLDGTKASFLVEGGAFPCWVNDDFILAVVSEDDGYVVTESKVVAVEVATGKVKQITPDDMLVEGVSATMDKVICTTENGDMYIMNVTIAE